MNLTQFKDRSFLPAIKVLFEYLHVPLNYMTDEPTTAQEILKDTYKDNSTFRLMNDVYFVGMVDDAAFEGNQSLGIGQIRSDYDGILCFGITLNQRENNLLPTRSQLAEISRAFNREFYYTPVVLVFKYQDSNTDYLAFANTERLPYKQAWREGEKAGKVALLRDIDINNPHSGHIRIITQLQIPTTGTKAIDSFAKLYAYWQGVFNVNILNKKFYRELSSWYFWALKNVTFPSKPSMKDVVKQTGKQDDNKLKELLQEHNATNVIRLLTRLLFTWFIKEKGLIPEELFDLNSLQKDILKNISPIHEEGLFTAANKESIYYKAILQNLFFASLNCPIQEDNLDKRSRRFRLNNHYGQDRGNDWMYRYEKYFKNPEAFLKLMNNTVPFLNGGLFECLDVKHEKNLYIDGFSDNMTKGEQLIVPDYLFFGADERVDLSTELGIKTKAVKQTAVKGLINILKSYKFTITENTPIEEDVALDPELLGKVFENLLASYNPETKTTARKQTGSFYTPREIVNYMVDESLIAHLKTRIQDTPEIFTELGSLQTDLMGNVSRKGQLPLEVSAGGGEFKDNQEQLDKLLHDLVSYDPVNPFAVFPETSATIVKYLDQCKILDPACGSGAFPMGALQKMVHILQKLDPENKTWQELQLKKALDETEEAYSIEDKQERQDKLLEIEDAFDEGINNPDFARKLYLIENCIYGVDIQPIATQIAKLRFFISLVVDQKVNRDKVNFGISPLPNLETRFVAANTLIGIEKPEAGQTLNIFDSGKLKEFEKDLKRIRHKLFSARTKETKLKYRQKDEELRNAIAEELVRSGWPNDTALKLASWDPYNQNASSSFFDPEWMFDISRGFDVVIGNPPYKQVPKGLFSADQFPYAEGKDKGKQNLYKVFVESSKNLITNDTGIACMIVQSSLLCDLSSTHTRELLLSKTIIEEILEFPKTAPTKEGQVFENVLQGTCIYRLINKTPNDNQAFNISINNDVTTLDKLKYESVVQNSLFELYPDTYYIPLVNQGDLKAILLTKNFTKPFNDFIQSINQGDLNLTSSSDYFS
ncbi:MAG: Eco57I restriction-modification methylase domain-containing protein, partial [Bacteroidota bacterium]|nr:Eco57I restriction-modification methylase domain-containing protein [Bacteroidota bacterium]